MNPLISIVTICRNDLAGLQRTHHSVTAQNPSLFEWIVVDGASTDATVAYLQNLPAGVAKWRSEPDRGIYDAMNKGIGRGSSPYCIFMNSGDEFAATDVLSKMAPYLDGRSDIVYGDAIEVFEEGEAYKRAFPARRHWYSMFTHHQAIFYKREALSPGYDVSFRLAADWALTSRLLMNGASTRYVNTPVCRFLRGGSSDNKRLRALADRELWRVYREVHLHNTPTALLLYLLKRAANILRFSAAPVYKHLRMKAAVSEKGDT